MLERLPCVYIYLYNINTKFIEDQYELYKYNNINENFGNILFSNNNDDLNNNNLKKNNNDLIQNDINNLILILILILCIYLIYTNYIIKKSN